MVAAVKPKNAQDEKNLQTLQNALDRFCATCNKAASQPEQRHQAMLNLLPTQPPEAPSRHESLVTLAKFRADLERCPDDKRGNWHEAANTAWTAMLQMERMVAQLIDLRFDVAGSTSHEAIDMAIAQIVETAGTLTEEAARRAEEDAPAYNSEDYWPRYRG